MGDEIEDLADLSPEEIKEAQKIFEGKAEGKSGCWHCAGIHDRVYGLRPDRQPCSRVQSAKWHPDGTLLEVVYWPKGSWEPSLDEVIYPRDVYIVEDKDDDGV